MSDFESCSEQSLPLSGVVDAEGVITLTGQTVLAPTECFKAHLMRAAYDTPPQTLPEGPIGSTAIYLKDFTCPYVTENGDSCEFTDPMVFLRRRVGLSAIGSSNFCELESTSPRRFKKAALGSLAVRAGRVGRQLGISVKQKFAR